MKKVLIAMSGGVDSSVAAYLLKMQGYECIGVTMKLYENEAAVQKCSNTCCSIEDIEDAKSVAYQLDIPHHVFNFTADFKTHVIQKFADAYEKGLTPNPCIDCNRYLKFDYLLHRALQLGCDYIATGHYAQIIPDSLEQRFFLKKAVDQNKDQSYVLYSMTQKQLSHTLLPLGTLCKDEVRTIAEKQGFFNAHKHDSQDICFVPDGDYAQFLRRYTKKNYPKGNFISTDGQVLGTHKGIIHYTIGQRKGLGISAPHPLYVQKKSLSDNTITLCEDADLYNASFQAKDFNLISDLDLSLPFRANVRIRYHQQEQPATITPLNERTLHIQFDTSQRAITSGQAAVLYQGDLLIGGGTILTY